MSPARGPNILLVVFDTARADAFEPYGATPSSSPTMADLARRGSAHPSCFSTACWTVPSHGSLFSGLLARSAGLGHEATRSVPATFRPVMQALRPRLLPEVLRRAGYHTAGVSTNLWISPHSGFDTGFERFIFKPSERASNEGERALRARIAWYLQAIKAEVDDGARAVEALLDDWATKRDTRPFFWFVNLVECHSPYLPPLPYNPFGPLKRVRAAAEARHHLTLLGIWRACVGDFNVPAAVIERMRELYEASIQQLDHWLERVLDLLERHRLLSDTQVIVTSDHGENFGEGGLLGHAFSLDDRLIRVPLVTAGPLDPMDGKVTSLASVAGWLAGAVGVRDHPFRGEDATEGVAVAQLDAPGTLGGPAVAGAIDGWGLVGAEAEHAALRLCTSFTAATDGRLKLVRRPGDEVLYDLASDPGEAAGIPVTGEIEQQYPTLPRLRAALDRASSNEITVERAGPSAGDEREQRNLDAQLRLLGYL